MGAKVVRVLGILFAFVLAVAMTPSAGGAVGLSSGSSDSRLRILEDSGNTLRARFETSASVVTVEARKASPTRDVVTVTINGKTLKADRDLATGQGSWGFGGNALADRDRTALTALLAAATSWRADAGAKQQLGGPKDLTIRLVMLASEAPAGVSIGTQSVDRPQERRLEKKAGVTRVVADPTATKTDSCLADVVSTTAANTTERQQGALACQQSNEDGILYFGCALTTRWLMHDAANHCMLGESISAGPRSSDCMGECGPGCNGLNIYTYDCGDHDRCGRVHGGSMNPWDSECGDEYFEADDDFFYGWPNC